ncbi:hypothetical protein AB9T88_15080 [Flavobacterium sp. LBUM151]
MSNTSSICFFTNYFSTTAGTGVQAKVSVTGGNQQTYQWYSNTTATTTGGSAISGGTSATVNFAPATANPATVYLYCVVTNGCTPTTTATSPVFTVNVTQDPSALTPGSGIFSGKTCFDINKSNYDGDCGTQSSRNSSMTNFQTQNVQPYTFTASTTGTKQNLRFVIVDPLGAVQSTNADAIAVKGNVSNGQIVTLTVTYKNTLSDVGSIAYGKTTAQAVNVKIYAIYNDGTNDLSVPLNVKIQDCACCGAYVAAGVWKNFLCHNLGADEGLDPFTPSQGINGSYYQWGRKDPVATAQTPPGGIANYDNTFPLKTALSNTVKTENDPCPAGYRIPTISQWIGVVQNNTKEFTGNWVESTTDFKSGVKFGKLLFLPAAGWRARGTVAVPMGTLSSRNKIGYYLSSSAYDIEIAQSFAFLQGYPGQSSLERMNNGFSVRCIEQ